MEGREMGMPGVEGSKMPKNNPEAIIQIMLLFILGFGVGFCLTWLFLLILRGG